MPLFNFRCSSCGLEQERMFSQTTESIKCNECDCLLTAANKLPSAFTIVSGVGFRSKVPDGFKDKLREMKKTGGKGSTIDV